MPPPASSKPEAANFPAKLYEFNKSKELFQPPQTYPEPPKNMGYEVPKETPPPAAKPKPVFPWEERLESVKPTRVFSEDTMPDPEPTPPMTIGTDGDEPSHPSTPGDDGASESVPVTTDEPFASFSPKNINAWDNHPGIDHYTRAFESAMFRRFGARAPRNTADIITAPVTASVASSSAEPTQDIVSPTPTRRRESLILTDFPSAIERPSLPVTPMPIRRSSFWGEERDKHGHLPAAEGVPDQAEWDPSQQLEHLRRQSLITAEEASHRLNQPSHEDIPRRDLPSSSAPIPASNARGEKMLVQPLSAGGNPHDLTAVTSGPTFGNVEFEAAATSEAEGDDNVTLVASRALEQTES